MMIHKAFTLIEVMVVVIVAVLAAVAIPTYNGYIEDSKENIARNTASVIATDLAAYISKKGLTHAPAIARVVAGGTVVIGTNGNKVKLPASFSMASLKTLT